MFEPLFTPPFSSLFSSLIAAAQRIFITVNGVDEYFTFQNTKTFPDDFDLSIDAVLPTDATTVTLFGQTASADHYIKVLSTGFVSINVDTSVVTSTVLATKDNKQRRYGVKLVGDDFIFTEDGATIDTVTDAVAAAKTLIINALCQSNGADFFNRTPSDPILTDLTTASNSVSWQLNRALPATTEQSSDGTNLLTYVGAPETELFTFIDGEWDGSNERVVNGNFSDGLTGWNDTSETNGSIAVVGGSLEMTSASGASGDRARVVNLSAIPLTTGAAYRLLHELSSSGINLRGGSSSQGNNIIPDFSLSAGVNTTNFTATASSFYANWYGNSANIVSLDNISVKRIIKIA